MKFLHFTSLSLVVTLFFSVAIGTMPIIVSAAVSGDAVIVSQTVTGPPLPPPPPPNEGGGGRTLPTLIILPDPVLDPEIPEVPEPLPEPPPPPENVVDIINNGLGAIIGAIEDIFGGGSGVQRDATTTPQAGGATTTPPEVVSEEIKIPMSEVEQPTVLSILSLWLILFFMLVRWSLRRSHFRSSS